MRLTAIASLARTRQPVQVASRTGNMEAIPDSLLVGDVY